MALNPYLPCLCGSGKQAKWCCVPYRTEFEKAVVQFSRGQKTAALAAMKQLTVKYPNAPEAFGYYAQLLLHAEELEQADAAVETALGLDPNYAYAYAIRGYIRSAENEVPGSLMLFRKYLELAGSASGGTIHQVYAAIAEAELGFNRPLAAKAAIRRAVAAQPDDLEFRRETDLIFGPNGRLPLHVRRDYALRTTPELADAWKPAIDASTTGKLGNGLRAWEQIARERPTDPNAAFNLGLTKAWLGDNRGALAALYQSIELEADEAKNAEAGLIAEILRGGQGLEVENDRMSERATFPIRDQMDPKVLTTWIDSGRLMVTEVAEDNAGFTGVLLDEPTDIAVEGGVRFAPILCYLVMRNHQILVWHSNRETLDRAVAVVQEAFAPALGAPSWVRHPVSNADRMAEIVVYPVGPKNDPSAMARKVIDRARVYFEEKWINRPLKSLNGLTPKAAADDPSMKRRLPGLVRYAAEGMRPSTATDEESEVSSVYSFDRLRRLLGLAVGTAGGPLPFDVFSGDELAALDGNALTTDQLRDAYHAAWRLGRPDLVERFATLGTRRNDEADRWFYFSELARSARDAGKIDEALEWLREGQEADMATNEGRRQLDYGVYRGQTLGRAGRTDEADAALRSAIDVDPPRLDSYAVAAETMLSAKQGPRAVGFAEQGLARARQQNNRDGEQQFLELVAAAKKLA